ncbi:S9 family peptidase [Rhizobium sp. BE258]|jgi:dipeptidyl aminopeptidase/acylaminoacyl peptidase|uniref:alpha/beta hydrolase family protein n=1 Tax=Rhizobium sp. BE258 TaxID=2817722 RepID=UPI000DDC2522|nr:alpha/beta fold hydrolase [Rhizobium sp. BE258]MDR7143001.1 dipeptidyl aminopeptidase/acylaminoacyl peptidase [Rhizobium sp. BE258]
MTDDQNAFFRQRRSVLAGLAGSLLLPGMARAFDVPLKPKLIAHDYAKVRTHFRTKLLQKGPAPDKYENLVAPADGDQIFYRSGAGSELELVAWVSKYKRTRQPKPAVLFLHGGNAMGMGHWNLMKPYMDAGFVVMMPSVRGENGQMGNFSGFYDEVDDVLAAADRMAHLPGVDQNRLFIAGHSIGGTLTMLASMSTHKFRAAAPISGNPDAFRFFNRYPQDIRFDDSNEREFEVRTALCYAESFKCPLRVMHGTEEDHFNDRADLLARRARRAGIRIETDTVAGNHTSALPAEIAQSIHFFQGVAA